MSSGTQFSTFFGIIIALALIVLAIFSGQGNPLAFIDLKSILIVIGGTFFVTSACFTIGDVFNSIGITLKTIFYSPPNMKVVAQKCLAISELSKKEGILKLQKHSRLFPASFFFKKNINLAIDGVKPIDLELLMENEINSISIVRSKTIDILKKGAEIAPAMGLIGTLIGLVQMLGNLEDPTKIGPAMALALLTTMYGAIISYMILLPLASKLERNSRQEVDLYVVFGEAIISIAKNEGPMKLEMKLNSTLPPGARSRRYS
jgi:chemotaxis protein MotA